MQVFFEKSLRLYPASGKYIQAVRYTTILVFGNFIRDFTYDYLDHAEAVIYELGEGQCASAKVYTQDALLLSEITAERHEDRITVSYTKTDCSFIIEIDGTESVEIPLS